MMRQNNGHKVGVPLIIGLTLPLSFDSAVADEDKKLLAEKKISQTEQAKDFKGITVIKWCGTKEKLEFSKAFANGMAAKVTEKIHFDARGEVRQSQHPYGGITFYGLGKDLGTYRTQDFDTPEEARAMILELGNNYVKRYKELLNKKINKLDEELIELIELMEPSHR